MADCLGEPEPRDVGRRRNRLSTLTVSTSLLTTLGTYTVTVTATIGSITHSVNLTVVAMLL